MCTDPLRSVRLSSAVPCLLSLTASSSALSLPADVPTMWDPSATLDPTTPLPPEIGVQQVQAMASIVLALLSEPFSECQYMIDLFLSLAFRPCGFLLLEFLTSIPTEKHFFFKY